VPTADLTILRERLVEDVRRTSGTISSAVADALRSVPRHLFVPEVTPETAYRDEAIVTKRDEDGHPISSSSQPAIMVLMLDQLGLAPGQRVLEIGAGTGYNAALISQLVAPGGEVVSVDIDLDLVQRARSNLARAGYPQVTVACADGAEGFAARAPYDRIIATVGVWDLVPSWLDQLAPGGRIVVPLDLRGVQRSAAFERADGHWESLSVVSCGFMRLRGALAGPERTHLLDRDADLSIMMPNGGDLDRQALLAALAQPPTRRPTGVTTSPAEIFRGLGLWLAINEPRWCVVSQSCSASGPQLWAVPLRIQDLKITAGILDQDGIAVLAGGPEDSPAHDAVAQDHEPGTAPVHALVALGYGPGGERLAAELAAHLRAWDAAGRPGNEGLRIAAYPKSTPDRKLGNRTIIDKRYTRLALSWPAADSTRSG
jgi:protein-L-isoaspartate(D-aspartate) O-methyltransferase